MSLEARKDSKPIDLSQGIELVEKEFMKLEQVKCDVIHRFAPGQYIREVHLPAGSLVIGHHQNFEHLNIFLKGRVAMKNDDGSFTEMKAPMIFTGKPGRKIGYIYEDVVWLNVFVTNETDIEKLENHFLTKSAGWRESVKLGESVKLLQSSVDQKDFEQVCRDLKITREQVRAIAEDEADMIDLPFGAYKIKVAKSNIEGKGLFATGDIKNGEKIAPARINGKRTIAGRFTNHSINPNARMVQGVDGDIDLVAINDISGCLGGLNGEEILINYREAYALTLEIGKRGSECQP